MPDYRIFTFDARGHVLHAPEVIICDTDEEALKKVKPLTDGRALEVWDGKRRVARIEPEGPAESPVGAANVADHNALWADSETSQGGGFRSAWRCIWSTATDQELH
jgi:hypothetical protein